MEIIELKNEILQVQISTHGGELLSIKKGNQEYIWQGDKTYWGRHAPILFPNVGKVWNDTYRVGGNAFHSKQHGFARDTEFKLIHQSATSLQLECLEYGGNDIFPYQFKLMVNYSLSNNRLSICWNVMNQDSQTIYFQIGAHPAFYYRDYQSHDALHGYVALYDSQNQSVSNLLASYVNGGYKDASLDKPILLNDNRMPLGNDTFAHDAIILENHQVQRIALLDKLGNAYLQLDAPQAQVFGLWAPNKEGCPFMCIEPWCGRTDRMNFEGDISEREYIQKVEANNDYNFDYHITILG